MSALGLRPFGGYVVRADVADRVVAPPRGQVASEQLEAHMKAEPLSILHVVRSGSSIPPERRPEHRLASARRLRSFLHRGIFEPLGEPTYLVHRSEVGDHTVTALLAEVPIAAYEAGHLRPHEHLREEQVERMTDHIDEVGASALPVLAVHRSAAGLDTLLEEAADEAPTLDVTVAGSRQRLWPVPPWRYRELEGALSAVHDLYVADGHHRAEAVRRVARRRRARATHPDPDAPDQHLLVAVAAADDLDTAPYHRWLRDPRPTDRSDLPDRLRAHGVDVTPAGPHPVLPDRGGGFGMLLDGEWFHLSVPDAGTSSSAVDAVDVSILHERILAPLFGVERSGSDPRLQAVPGADGADALVQRCRREGGVGFTLAPIDVGTVLDVADEGGVLPPKSTLFVPKLSSGLVLQVIAGLGGPADPQAR